MKLIKKILRYFKPNEILELNKEVIEKVEKLEKEILDLKYSFYNTINASYRSSLRDQIVKKRIELLKLLNE